MRTVKNRRVKGVSCGMTCIQAKKRCSEGATLRAAQMLEKIAAVIREVAQPAQPREDTLGAEAFSFLRSKGIAEYAREDEEPSWKEKQMGLTSQEAAMIGEYTSTIGSYAKINRALRNPKRDADQKGWMKVEKLLNRALDKMESTREPQVFRVADLKDSQLDQYRRIAGRKDKSIKERAFTSASEGDYSGKFGGNTNYVIIPKQSNSRGKTLDTNEDEVLFKSKTRFSVESVETKNARNWRGEEMDNVFEHRITLREL